MKGARRHSVPSMQPADFGRTSFRRRGEVGLNSETRSQFHCCAMMGCEQDFSDFSDFSLHPQGDALQCTHMARLALNRSGDVAAHWSGTAKLDALLPTFSCQMPTLKGTVLAQHRFSRICLLTRWRISNDIPLLWNVSLFFFLFLSYSLLRRVALLISHETPSKE